MMIKTLNSSVFHPQINLVQIVRFVTICINPNIHHACLEQLFVIESSVRMSEQMDRSVLFPVPLRNRIVEQNERLFLHLSIRTTNLCGERQIVPHALRTNLLGSRGLIVIPPQDDLPAIELREEHLHIFHLVSTKAKITQMDEPICRSHMRVVDGDQSVVHRFGGGEWPSAIFDYVRVIQVIVARHPNLLIFFAHDLHRTILSILFA